ncbi:hypothetical protein ACHAXR_012510 [Thalassiosira sp. AJA248-18]
MRALLSRDSTASIALVAIISNHNKFLAYAFTPSLQVPSTSCSRHFFTTHASTRNAVLGTKLHSTTNAETISSNGATSPSMQLVEQFLSQYETSLEEGQQWAHEFGFAEEEETAEGAFYAIFRAIRKMDSNNGISSEGSGEKLLGLSGTPFYVPAALLAKAEENSSNRGDSDGTNMFSNYFHFPHLATALEEDFLDAQRGSTDNRKGWQVSAVSQPTGSSFDDARMTLSQVKTALESGTVIFNNIGSHIPRLAGPTLASTDALSLPGALNMYVTAKGMRTSAPPHTDRQDVLVVQMEGAKRWRVFSPPTDGDVKPNADPFARGKGEDSIPLHVLLEGKTARLGTELLMDVVTREGDVLFIPAGFPHTTDTVEETEDADYDTSIHLTFNIDTHVWLLDHLSVRNAALRRSGVSDVLAPQSFSASNAEINLYTGKVNQLPTLLRSQLVDALPLEFLDVSPSDPAFAKPVVDNLTRLSSMVNEATDGSATISSDSLQQALERIHSYGSSILDIHRDMYLAAVEEGRLRQAEAAMTAHIKDSSSSSKITMTPEKMQRLSLFRVRPFFEQIDQVKKEFEEWCVSGNTSAPSSSDPDKAPTSKLDPNWQFTAPLKNGDEVEADLGGAFFAAKISKIAGNNYEVVFFDGDRDWLERDQIKLLKPPSLSPDGDEIDTTGLTKKEIKRLKKKMEKKKNK